MIKITENKNKGFKINYKKTQIIVVVLIVVGCGISLLNLGATSMVRYVPKATRYVIMITVYMCIPLTIIVFIIYPILYLRKMNKTQLGITK